MSGVRVRSIRFGVAIGFAMLLAMPYPVAATGLAAGAPIAPGADAADTSSWIVALKKGADSGRSAARMATDAGGKSGLVFRHALNGFVFKGSAKAADALRHNPNVRSVVANGKVHITADTITTGISRIRADHATEPSANGSGFTGNGVRVAVLDTGIDLTHPDLVPNLDLPLGRNCITAGPPQDGHGHGTHVAGIVAAAENGLGVIGVAPDAKLVPIKVLDDTGQGEWSNLICAVDYLTELATDADPTNDVRVANMSLGDVGGIGSCTDGSIREAICHSVAAGVVYIAAAGNSTVDTSTFIPAAFPEVIAVSALTDLDGEPGGLGGCWLLFFFCDDTLAEFSNYGATVDVTAPGTQIYSDWTGGGYMTEMGTSMASPHVAGVAALMVAAFPSLTPADVEDLLKSTGTCPNGEFADEDGGADCTGKGQWGNDPDGIAEPLVSALHASEGGTTDRKPVVDITAPTDGASVSGSVPVTATATDDVGVTKVDFFVNGILSATDTDGSDGWSMTWNASAVAGGAYTIKATATDTANHTASDSVTVWTSPNAQGSWVGNYGQDGYVLANWNGTNADLASLPAGVSFTLEQGARYTWASPTTDVRALVGPTGTERRSQTWYDLSELRMRLNFSTPYSGVLHLYALDWDAYQGNRYEDVTINDGSGPRTIRLSSSFVPGGWIHVPVSVAGGGSVAITAHKTAGDTAVVAGLFLGGGGTPPPPPPQPTVDLPGVRGSWVGNYGQNGYVLAGWNGSSDLVGLPAGVTAVVEQAGRFTWASPTTDVRGLQSPNQTERRAATWHDLGQVRVRLNFASAYSGVLHAYAVDWDTYGPRGENISVDDGQGRRTIGLAANTFVQGAWAHFPFQVPAGGSLVVTVDRTAGGNAVLSGLFLGSGGTPPPPPPPPTVELPGRQGSWVGTYGIDGYVLANWNSNNVDLASLPAGVTFVAEQANRWTFASPTTDIRGLQSPSQTERRGQTWHDLGQVRLRLNFATAYSGTLHLYAVDWDSLGRGQNVSVDDGQGRRSAVLAASSFVQGAWIHVPIQVPAGGSVVITADRTAGANAVLSGLFLGGGTPPPPTVPGAPTGLTATRGNGQVALAWTAPASNGGSAITSYTATAVSGGGTCSTATLGCTIAGLANGTPYTFSVTATNAVGTGPASASASATPATVPGAPTGLGATPANGQVALAWAAPASDGGSAIGSYTATASPGGASCTAASLGCTITGLANGTPYTFTVTATNAVGTGPLSASASATPLAPATVPGPPTGLGATPGNGQAALTWAAPASDGGSSITSYTATASPGGATCSTATLGCTIGGLANGTSYTFTVTATNALGTGPASASASATPVAPLTVPDAPTGLTATAGNGQVILAWAAPASDGGSSITSYTATASPGGATCSTAALGCTISGLTNGTSYTFTVRATNAVGTGPASASAGATPATVPGAPTGLVATAGNGQVALAWAAPASNGGSSITSYTAIASPGGATCTTATLGCTISRLTNGTSYTFTVRATNAIGSGAASASASATPATLPGAPTGLVATAGNTQVGLVWAAPASNGGRTIISYTATASPGGRTCTTATLACTITGLTNGTAYTFTVKAMNAIGAGPASASASATPATIPGVPRNLNATRSATRGVNLAWIAPASNGGAAISGYRIYRSTSSGAEVFLVAVGNVLSYVDTANTPGVRYYYKVTAINVRGEGPQSAETNARAR